MKRTLSEIWERFQRYIIATALFALFVVVLAACAGKGSDDSGSGTEAAGTEIELDSEMKVDAVKEINDLFAKYYGAYAKADFDTLTEIAHPMTDTEKSYIGVYSQYIKNYSNLKCYTTSVKKFADGTDAEDNAYLVSVRYSLEFYGVKTLAEGIDFFYVRKDEEKGALYIDNAYSSFNYRRTENPLDPGINAAIIEYGKQEEVVRLREEVDAAFNKAIAGDKKLADMIATTIPKALKDWRETLGTESEEQNAKTDGKSTEATSTEKTGTAKADEAAKKIAEEKAKAEAAKKAAEKKAAEKKAKAEEKANKKTKTKKTTNKVKTTDRVFLREKPSTDADYYEVADKGKVYTVASEKDGWTKVKYGQNGAYIKSEYLKKVK